MKKNATDFHGFRSSAKAKLACGVITDPHGTPLTPFNLSRNPNDDLPFLAGSSKSVERLLWSIRSSGNQKQGAENISDARADGM